MRTITLYDGTPLRVQNVLEEIAAAHEATPYQIARLEAVG